MRINAKHLVSFLGLIALSGCGRAPVDSSVSSPEIVGGEDIKDTQADARRWSTVALTTDYKKEGKPSTLEQNHSFCSGTLVAPRVVVTAAHCIQAFDATTRQRLDTLILPKETDFLVHFDTNVAMGGRWIRAKRAISHQDWDPAATLTPTPTKAPNDIGILILESDAPATHKPAAIADLSATPAANEAIHLAGYGVTKSRNTNDTGILRQVSTKFSSADAKSQRMQVGRFLRGACAGDSGGPLYFLMGNEYQLAGATSTGAELLGQCLGLINFYTDVRYYKSWIEETAAANM